MTMTEPLIDRFWDATLDEGPVDLEGFLNKGGDEIRSAVHLHRLLRETGKRWRRPELPRKLGRFEVVGHLGAGGLGRVFLGWDPELRRHVAIKVIERDRWAINEARSIARLDHRAVVKVHEVGHDRVVMELLDGGSLRDEIDALRENEQSRLPTLRERLHCLVRIAEGLAYCHQRGVLHRDVKPGNVLFARDDVHPRLIDFGLAHVPQERSLDITQHLVGTPAYVAPEQVDSGETGTDPRTDQFSFGVLAFELLTLENPFARETRTQTLDAVRAARPTPPRRLCAELPESVERIVLHCLEPDPRDRYQKMEEVVSDLREALADRPISIGKRGLVHHARLWYRRNRRLTQVALAGVAAAAAVGVLLWASSVRATRAETLEEIGDVERRIPELRTASEFHDAGLKLSDLHQRADRFDRGVIRSLLLGAAGPPYERASEQWSRQLGQVVAEAEAANPLAFSGESWKIVFQLDQYLCPQAAWNSEFWKRGKVLLSPELEGRADLRLSKQTLLGEKLLRGYRDFREVAYQKDLPAGYYRLELPGSWEREFVVPNTMWFPPIEIEREARPDLGGELRSSPVLPGLVFSQRITTGQYEAFLETSHPGREEATESPEDLPFSGTWNQAQEFAVWAGGRLPTAKELGALIEAGEVGLETTVIGEHVSDLDLSLDPASCAAFRWDQWEPPSDQTAPMSWLKHDYRDTPLAHRLEDGSFVGVGFRVIFPESD